MSVRQRILVAALACGMAGTVLAQGAWPSKTVRLIMPFPAGGSVDILARGVADGLGAQLGQSVVVETRTGAAGIVGSEVIARAAPDGYTFGVIPDVISTIYPQVYAKLPFDPLRDLAPIQNATTLALALFAHPSVKANSLRELIVESKGGTAFSFGTPGNGTPMHLGGELINLRAGTKLAHVPYRGGGPAVVDLLGGQIPLAIAGVGSGAQHVKSGKLKALATLGAKRAPGLPDTPTVAESGVDGYDVASWLGFFAPTGTPEAIVQRLNAEIAKVLAAPAFRERLLAGGMEVVAESPAVTRERIARESKVWADVIKRSGIKLEQ